MTTRQTLLPLFACLALAGCAQPGGLAADAGSAANPPPPAAGAGVPATPPSAGTCDAGAVQGVVGTAVDDTVTRRAQDAAGAASVRVVRPGQAVTMDFNPMRLNVDVDDRGRITGLRCG